ncbi:MAG: glycoside hydrolase [Anaerolineae bacterium]|nr:glycoside hydrolase [Anaerolineae bacterium]
MKKWLFWLLVLMMLAGCRKTPPEIAPTESAATVIPEDQGQSCTTNQECDSYYCHFADISTGQGVCGVPSQMEDLLEKHPVSGVVSPLISIGDGSVMIYSERLTVTVQGDGFVMTLLDKNSGKEYKTEFLDDYQDPTISVADNGAVLVYPYAEDDTRVLTVHIQVENDSVHMTLDLPVDTPMESLTFPGAIATQSGEWLVLPRASGTLMPVEKIDLWGFSFFTWKSSMNFIGVIDAEFETGWLMRMEEAWSSEVYFDKSGTGNPILPYPVHLAEKGIFGQPRHITYTVIDSGGYVTMAEKQYDYAWQKGYIKIWDEKILENPNTTRLIGAADIWLGCGFGEVIEAMPDYGFDHALINFYDSLPTENDICTDEIVLANQLGYLTGRYDIYSDVWSPDNTPGDWMRTEGYPEDVIVKADGDLQEGWLHKEDGLFGKEYQGYYTSSATHLDVAKSVIEADLANNPYLARFIDVALASELMEDYSTDHPATRQDDMYYRMQLLDLVSDGMGLVTGSEEFHEWAVPFLAYSEGTMTILPEEDAGYDWAAPVDRVSKDYVNYNISPVYRIPLQQLVYHDSHATTWYTGDGASKVPDFWDDKDLLNALYGSMPLFMPPDIDYWGDNIIRFTDSYHIAALTYRETGRAKMIDHRFLTADRLVQETEFENGWVVTANFRSQPYEDERFPFPLAAKGLYATDGQWVIAKMEMGGGAAIAVQLDDRIYLHPQGGGVEYGGFRTSSAILLQWEPNGDYQLTLVGGQRSVQLNTFDIPMKLSIGRFEDREGNIITFKDLGDGWIELRIPAGTMVINWIDHAE